MLIKIIEKTTQLGIHLVSNLLTAVKDILQQGTREAEIKITVRY